jgi:CHASE3 domain sensor protein
MRGFETSRDIVREWWAALRTPPSGMGLSRRGELLFGVCLFFCLLIVTAVAEYRQTIRLQGDAHLTVHAHEFVEALDELLLTVRKAETGHTYYLMTGEDRYLKTYADAIDETKRRIEGIKRLAENSLERQRLPRLQSLVGHELDELAVGMTDAGRAVTTARLTALAAGETDAMNALEAEVDLIEQYERDLLKTEEKVYANDYRWAVGMILAAGLAALAWLAAFLWLLRRHTAQQARAGAAAG